MGALAIAVLYVLFVWWFSTGTVLLLVGLSGRHQGLLKAGAAILFAASLVGVAASSQVTTAAGAYCVFTCAILLWGAVEISLLAGWVTGPRPEACPPGCSGRTCGFAPGSCCAGMRIPWRRPAPEAAWSSGSAAFGSCPGTTT